jgi:hypothetical protein
MPILGQIIMYTIALSLSIYFLGILAILAIVPVSFIVLLKNKLSDSS